MLAEKAEHYLSEGALTRDMVTDYVKEVKIYGADDYRITWKYPELFEEMREKQAVRRTQIVSVHFESKLFGKNIFFQTSYCLFTDVASQMPDWNL